ncbi:MAG: tRNA (adenosine(37)-N6)-threonylcarbamoyltransferase complex ATPase subunit type 1 TsaE [Chlorobiaceae bacterium]
MAEQFASRSAEETRAIARQFASSLKGGEVVALSGQLGAGKTEFMRGVTEFFGCDDQLSSPTFPIFNIYQGSLQGEPLTIHHFDLYRIDSLRELEALGFDEYIDSADLSFVEWSDRFPQYAGIYSATVLLEHSGEEMRAISIKRRER